jgi:predicted dienelactone hydrolase
MRKKYLLKLVVLGMLSTQSFAQELITLTRADKNNVAMQVYLANDKQCTATAIISHGAGGSENGYEYLAEFLRKNNWLVMVVGHKESGSGVLFPLIEKNGLLAALGQMITTPSAYQARFMDINAARTWANKRCSSPLTVLIGHSMGAATAMIEAGAKNKLGLTGTDSFDAYVAMSPQGVGTIFVEDAWKSIKKPVLMLTGTKDNELNGKWETRKDAFASLPVGCKWLGVIDGATHMNFAERGFSGKTENLVMQTVLAFLNGVKAKNCVTPEPNKGINLQAK